MLQKKFHHQEELKRRRTWGRIFTNGMSDYVTNFNNVSTMFQQCFNNVKEDEAKMTKKKNLLFNERLELLNVFFHRSKIYYRIKSL